MRPTFIIITGHPGSGKTSIARQLSDQYRIPVISKDALKERMFDVFGAKDKQWSLQVSGVAHRIMDDMASQILKSGNSVIVESNFKAEIDSERFAAIANNYHVSCLQILCKADGDTLFERWNNRISEGERHEGHAEEISLEQIREDLSQPYPKLTLSGKFIELDTTDFSSLVLPTLVK